MLVERQAISVPAVLNGLVGLQSQAALAPYVGLWAQVRDFERADLADLIEARSVVKAAWIRGTLHLVTADDYAAHRSTLQPMLTQGFDDIVKRRGPGIDVGKVVAAARGYFGAEPHTFAELSAWLTERYPDDDVGSLRHAVRMHLPIVQVPIETGWSYPGKARFTLADDWLGTKVSTKPSAGGVVEMVQRYLGAFGPASVTDMVTWSGLPGTKEAVEQLRPKLTVYRDEKRTELFDLPDLSLPDPDMPVPPRFLPEYDNVLRSHRKRTRIVADEHRKRVYLPGLRVAATILVDGFVAGTWKVEKAKGRATLVVEPFGKLAKADRTTLADEAERLVRFVEPEVKGHAVQV